MNERQRLLQIMESEGMNARQFSMEVGISQGTLSNIMGGRNNPSLEVLQAVLNRFRTIQSDWLILGIGSMYRPNGDGPQLSLLDIRPNETESTEPSSIPYSTSPQSAANTDNTMKAGSGKNNPTTSQNYDKIISDKDRKPLVENAAVKQVKRIIVFYTDGTYEER